MLKRMSTLRITVGAMVLALAGLIALQWHLLRQALELKDQAFRRNALAALNTAAQRLEAGETYRSVLGATLLNDTNKARFRRGHNLSMPDTIVGSAGRVPGSVPVRLEQGKLVYSVGSPQRVRIQRFELGGGRDTTIVDTFRTAGQYTVNVGTSDRPGKDFFYRYITDSSHFVVESKSNGGFNTVTVTVDSARRRRIVNRALDLLFVGDREPIENKITPARLDSVLHLSFEEAGISLGFDRGVATEGDTTLKLVAPDDARERLRRSDLRALLFPADLLSPRSSVIVDFPGQESYVFWRVGPLFGATAILTLIIVWAFVYAVRTIILQKRAAGLMTDFVNNMTHEFKTPISTVALAVEAIARPEVTTHTEKILQYNNVIRDETTRLRRQVEKILEMATLERGEYELNVELIDIHALIKDIAVGVALQIAHRGGTLTLALDAQHPIVQADRLHLTNIVHNLLDNAIKYSRDTPVITVQTRSQGKSTSLAVADRGIGIGSEHQERVFEKYYRVPTGNIHDVKGFGLGLSYVKMMVEAMGGKVALRSKLGEGTTVEVSLNQGGLA